MLMLWEHVTGAEEATSLNPGFHLPNGADDERTGGNGAAGLAAPPVAAGHVLQS